MQLFPLRLCLLITYDSFGSSSVQLVSVSFAAVATATGEQTWFPARGTTGLVHRDTRQRYLIQEAMQLHRIPV